MDFFETLTKVNNAVNTFVWTNLGLVLLIGAGILLTCATKFFQVAHIKEWWMKTIGGMFGRKSKARHNKEAGSVSQFQALCTALAATIGTGNIAGVASAICVGGPGAVFWMWIAAFFGMMTNFSENILGIYYRRKNAEGEWSGGAMYYLRDGLGGYKGCKYIGRFFAGLFAVFAVLASFGIGNMGQINKIVINLDSAILKNVDLGNAFGDVKWTHVIIGVVLMILGGLIILGGLKRIAAFAEKVVPFMACLYILGCIIVFFANITQIGPIFASIFRFAFSVKAVGGAVVGISIKQVITQGCKRGVFSNEAGLGSSVMVHSASNVREPVKQGMWGIFEVFADTFVVCTLTAVVVLSSGKIDLQTGNVDKSLLKENVRVVQTMEEVGDIDNGYIVEQDGQIEVHTFTEGTGTATLVADSFGNVFGAAGSVFVSVAILLFAFTTVVGWSHYGSKSFEYLFGLKAAKGYKIFFVLMMISGAVMTSSLAWDISDTFNGLMMVPNLIGVLACLPMVVKITKNYVDRRIKKLDVEPLLSYDPAIQAEHAKDVELEMREERESSKA
ncbi:MAG: alanine:cation symporter family protein [Lachnospiraceae bacterium]|nr:alanine:cation symporter family protein [Lachnospiraceae bacterium]